MAPPPFTRRIALAAGLVAPLAANAQGARPRQPDAATPEGFMALAQRFRAEAIAAGDQAYGAVLVLGGEAVGEGVSAVVTTGDPTAHAEMRAIRDACRRLGQRNLAGAVLYSTSRPCSMCEAAASWAGVERMIHGAGLVDAGRPRLPPSPAC